MTQPSLFDDEIKHPSSKPPDLTVSKRVLITVTAAPNPSVKHGETVCVAGIELSDLGPTNWIRLYPINLRLMRGGGEGFHKYDVVSVACRPANGDARVESWNPDLRSLKVQGTVAGWEARRAYIDPLATDTMCGLFSDVQQDPLARSLGLARPVDISAFKVEKHPGWTADEQRKIDAFVNQFELFSDQDKTPLEAPRMKGSYKWRCSYKQCRGHEQQLLDWEFLALERHLRQHTDGELKSALKKRFLDEVCASDREVAFYVGNQAKRHHTFSILGVYWPKKSTQI